MATNLAQARRNRYGARNTNDGAAEDSPSQYYNANGSRTGARIDGSVKRKTMMGGASQGPISARPNRSEMMEKEAEAQMEASRQKGEARARAQERARRTSGQRPDNGVDVTPGTAAKPAGMLIPGSAPGSSIWVRNNDPRLKPLGTATADKSAQASTPEQLALIAARKKKGEEGMKFARSRAAIERSVSNSTGGGSMNWRRPDPKTKQQGELAELRDRGSADIWFGNEKF